MARIGIIGSKGRMGQAIATAITVKGEQCAGGIDVGDSPADLAKNSDVLVDFSSPDALEANLDAAITAGTPILIGTTGLAERHHFLIDSASQSIAVLQTGNTSLGVNVLTYLVKEAAKRLGTDWDIEICETHHRMKVDAPSGTALMLGEAAASGRGDVLDNVAVRGRDGITGKRKEGAVGFASLRGGSVAGDHQVLFLSDNERLVLGHLAENRSIFAKGAVHGALWLIGQQPGRYTMAQVLSLDGGNN